MQPTETPNNEQNAIISTTRTRGSRGGGRGRGRGTTNAPTVSRFKPKNVRRSAAELAELAHKEDVRKIAALAEIAREQARLSRGRGRPRGRGDTMGRGRGSIGGASSIFGVAPEGLKKVSGMLSLNSGGGGGHGVSGGYSGTTTRNPGQNDKSNYHRSGAGEYGRSSDSKNFIPLYPDEDEDVLRVDIENINLISDDETEPGYSGGLKLSNKEKSVAKGGCLRPVRLHREEHKERVTIVNTVSDNVPAPPAIKAPEEEEDGLFVVDKTRSISYKKELENLTPNKSKRDVSCEPLIKEEFTADELFDSVGLFPSNPPSNNPTQPPLESLQKIHSVIDSSTLSAIPESKAVFESGVKPDLDPIPTRNVKQYGKKFVIQTEEDRAEYERHLEDIAILTNELGTMQENNSSRFQDANGDGDRKMEDVKDVQEEQDKKDGRLYLFQFPPILPALYNPLTEENSRSSVKVKQETTEKDQDLAATDSRQKSKEKSKEIDLTLPAPYVKLEVLDDFPNDVKKDVSDRTETVHEEGFIGKLVVRESGRVELCWGGTSFLVGRGFDADFLTTGVIVDSVERGPQGGGVPEGKALGMGQIMGKFVVTPDWYNIT